MKLECNKLYNGFKFLEERKIDEIQATGRVFIHENSGARLFHLECDDDNKVFSITFRTPAPDNKGIPHILEHSVLCGSRKFPSKEPFVELAKGSLSTFLNALTFPDKTMYPVASRNEKDLFNLMDVYLDAVFFPNIYKFPEIFQQEGWHYKISNERIHYNGVVYNEMKGSFSTPEMLLFRKIPQSLFPDTTYGFESGGDPDEIPRLSFEEFIDFHKKYYHPSNSYIFLYGNGNLLEQLKFIHHNYLKDFNRIDVNSDVQLQKPFTQEHEMSVFYPISEHEDESEKSYLSLNYVTGKATDSELYLAMDILEYLLLETPAAPLKKALIEARIGKDVFGMFDKNILQPVFSVIVKNTEEERKERFREVVYSTLSELVKKGIDRRLIEASINIKEFALREADYRGLPKGLVYCIHCMDSWLYGEEPFKHLCYEEPLKRVKKAFSSAYFENLIDIYLLKNNHRSVVIVNPSRELLKRKEQELRSALLKFKESLSPEEMKTLLEQEQKLINRQKTTDNPEAIEAIPLLSLKDINPKAEELPIEVRDGNGLTILAHPMFTQKIVYLNLFFNTSSLPVEDLPYASLLAGLLGKISTKNYSYSELSNEINIHTGGMYFVFTALGQKDNDSIFYPKMIVKSKALVSRAGDLARLIKEISCNTLYNERDRIREVVQEIKSRMEMSIYEQGHMVAASRLMSYFSPVGSYTETIGGFTFYRFITELEKNFENKFDELSYKLQQISKKIFNRKNILLSITTAEEDYKKICDIIPGLISKMDDKEQEKILYYFDFKRKNEGLLTPSQVQFVAKGYNFKKLGFTFSGSMLVLKQIATLDYLWNRVRVQGGAYGSFAQFSRNGIVYFTSYRDPNLEQTIKIYDDMPKYIKSFEVSEREMRKYILGTVSRLDAPLTPSMKGEVAAERYINGLTQEEIQITREKVLATRKKDIVQFAELLEEVMKQNYFCVIGNEGKLKENSQLFSELVPVFEN